MHELDVCLELLLAWLAERHGRRFAIEQTEEPRPDVVAATAADGSHRLAVEAHPLLGPVEDPVWLANRDELQKEIAADLAGAYALWLPPGADLPTGTDERAELVKRVREIALGLEAGRRSYVPLPVSVFLRKLGDDGALVSVAGGLNHYWARLSERVKGSFDLDSTRLHRLPESEEHLDQLCEMIWERAARMEAGVEWVELRTVDAWTVQHLRGDDGVAIIGRPPKELGDVGLTVRRNLRRLLADAAPRLRGREAEVKALVVLGHYGRMEEEGATTAMRGYDPALYSGLDFVCLAADGLIKALIEMPSPSPS